MSKSITLGIFFTAVIGLGILLISVLREPHQQGTFPGAGGHKPKHSRTAREQLLQEQLKDRRSGTNQHSADEVAVQRSRLKHALSSDLSQDERMEAIWLELKNFLAIASFTEALAILNEELGEGSERTGLLIELFHHSTESIDFLTSSMASLEGVDAEFAAMGLTMKILSSKSLSGLDMLFADELSPHALQGFRTGVQLALSQHADAPALLEEILHACSTIDPEAGSAVKLNVLHAALQGLPTLVWQTLDKNPPTDEKLQGQVERLRSAALVQLLSKDAKSTLLMLIRDDAEPKWIGNAVEYWSNQSSKAASEWFSESGNSLSSAQAEAAASGFAKQASGKGNFETAWEWLGKIDDPEAKRRVEGEVWNAERAVIRQETNKNPSETIQSLISGESKHADYWIEEAMMTWIAKEPDKSEEWYQANWNSLPPAKSQYVAAAYAKNALGLGDTATARQWTGLIQDPKIRERIEASITKAEAGTAP